MQIKCGTTRVVLLLGNHAIKIAKIRFLFFLRPIKDLLFNKERRKHLVAKYACSPRKLARNSIAPGFFANRNEYRYSRLGKDSRVMPVKKQFLWGFVIVQERGIPILPEEFPAVCPLQGLEDGNHDLNHAHQFCRRPGDQTVRARLRAR